MNKAEEYLMNQMNTPEFISNEDNVNESFKVIGNIMQSFSDEQKKEFIEEVEKALITDKEMTKMSWGQYRSFNKSEFNGMVVQRNKIQEVINTLKTK